MFSEDGKAIRFTDKEEAVLKHAWACLKSGVPDVDIKKLTKAAGFNTEKTCANTWSVIKRKLQKFSESAVDEDNGESSGEGAGPPATPGPTTKKPPKKGIAMPVKRNRDGEDGDGVTAQKRRKCPVKKPKFEIAEEDEAEH